MGRDPFKLSVSVTFLVVLALSLVRPPYPEFLTLQHVPTLAAVIGISLWNRRWPIGRGAFGCLAAMLILHVIGARYLYSFVPYDDWSQAILGLRLSEALELQRNHYDRLVHLCFGLLLVWPIREFLERYKSYSRTSAIVIAILAIMGTSMLYEIVEWLISVAFSPDYAENYNGQQGDFWDAQKDMALAFCGAVLAGVGQWRRR